VTRLKFGEFDKKTPWLKPGEAIYFKRLRSQGRITFFRISICETQGCEEEVPKGKRFCSKKHYEETEGEFDDGDEEEGD